MDFNLISIGDRVMATRGNIDANKRVTKGLCGTVAALDTNRSRVGVLWDVDVGGHSLGGRCPKGFGWWAFPSELSAVDDERVVDESMIASPEELFAFINAR